MNRVKFRHGFSLLELMVAIFICSAFILGFFKLLSSSTTRLTLTTHTFSANHAAAKVIADLVEESRINVTLLELFEEYPDMVTRDKIIKGQSYYFRHLIDRSPPWGIIESSTDGGIEEEDGYLFRQMEPFTLKVSAHRIKKPSTPGFERHIADVNVEINWREKDGMKRSYGINSYLPSPFGPIPMEGILLFQNDKISEIVREMFFPSLSGYSLQKAAQNKGSDPDLILNIGKVAVSLDSLGVFLATSTREIEDLTNLRRKLLANPSTKLVRAQFQIARRCEKTASLIYNVLLALNPAMKEIKEKFSIARLGALPYAKIVPAFWNYVTAVQNLHSWIERVSVEYEWLMNPNLRECRSKRTEEYALAKTLESFRLLSLIDPKFRSKYQAFVRVEKGKARGKNPFWERLFTREEKLMSDSERMKQIFGNLKEVSNNLENVFLPYASMSQKIMVHNFP